VDGAVTAGDVATVTIEDRPYSYTAVTDDTLVSVRDRLVELINGDPKVTATASGQFTRILIRARIEGPEGNGIALSATSTGSGTIIMTAFSTTLCCANVEGSAVTQENPAVPGEVIYLYATGLGLPVLSEGIPELLSTGKAWPVGGPVTTPPSESGTDSFGNSNNQSVSSLAGGKTADVLAATLMPGTVGTYLVVLHLNGDLASDLTMPVTIAQDVYVSNVVAVPLINPVGQ